MIEILIQSAIALLLAAGVALVVYAAELKYPRGPQLSDKARIRAGLFMALNIPTYALAAAMLGVIHTSPPINAALLGTLGATIALLFAYDFFYYWLHRAQHRFPILWRYHSVHHSIEEMGAPTGYHHLSEAFVRALFCGLPISFIFSGTYVPVIVGLGALHGFYVHSNVRYSLGRFALVIADNRCHRIHHSLDPQHKDRNFGSLSMVWDKVFGTAYYPARDEWPKIGIEGRREVANPFGLIQLKYPVEANNRVVDKVSGRKKDFDAIDRRGV